MAALYEKISSFRKISRGAVLKRAENPTKQPGASMATKSRSATKTRPEKPGRIEPARGKLGIMMPGMGAVATTFVAGVEAVRRGYASPIGSVTQMGTIRLGKRTDRRSPQVKDFVPLAT